eukprot:4640776-Pleurochrysis_carterae.AAC.1
MITSGESDLTATATRSRGTTSVTVSTPTCNVPTAPSSCAAPSTLGRCSSLSDFVKSEYGMGSSSSGARAADRGGRGENRVGGEATAEKARSKKPERARETKLQARCPSPSPSLQPLTDPLSLLPTG